MRSGHVHCSGILEQKRRREIVPFNINDALFFLLYLKGKYSNSKMCPPIGVLTLIEGLEYKEKVFQFLYVNSVVCLETLQGYIALQEILQDT